MATKGISAGVLARAPRAVHGAVRTVCRRFSAVVDDPRLRKEDTRHAEATGSAGWASPRRSDVRSEAAAVATAAPPSADGGGDGRTQHRPPPPRLPSAAHGAGDSLAQASSPRRLSLPALPVLLLLRLLPCSRQRDLRALACASRALGRRLRDEYPTAYAAASAEARAGEKRAAHAERHATYFASLRRRRERAAKEAADAIAALDDDERAAKEAADADAAAHAAARDRHVRRLSASIGTCGGGSPKALRKSCTEERPRARGRRRTATRMMMMMMN